MNLPEDDPNRMDYFRKYSAIYGRFDSKRRGGKQMNFHEVWHLKFGRNENIAIICLIFYNVFNFTFCICS